MMDTFDEYCLFMEHDKSLQCILARHFIYRNKCKDVFKMA